jgi:hypothetical protein
VTIADDGSTLTDALRALERRMLADRPQRVVLADDSDTALAAALVATKLEIAVAAQPAARERPSTNGRLIAQLAPAYTESA